MTTSDQMPDATHDLAGARLRPVAAMLPRCCREPCRREPCRRRPRQGAKLVSMERCDVCGYEWDAVSEAEIPSRLRATAAGFQQMLSSGDASLGERPAPAVWSVMEYCAHVRDVMFNVRDRIILGLAEDHPTPKPMYQDVRIENDLYREDTPSTMSTELGVAIHLMAKTVAALDAPRLDRTLVYGWPRPADRSLRWVAAQALHEAEHHLADARSGAQPRTPGQ
jgi:DNA segregation ATPase FtsK/SpoIIIE, S-DNA-T family